MRTMLLSIFLTLISPVSAHAYEQPEFEYPALPKVITSSDDLISPGLVVISKAQGDLNNDGHTDIALVLWTNEAAKAETREEREGLPSYRLLIALARVKGGYQIVEDDSDFLTGPDPWGVNNDPLDEKPLRIVRGTLAISRTYLRGQYRHRFRWVDGAFRLIGYDFTGSDGRCVSEKSINFQTRIARMETEELVAVNPTTHRAVRRTKARLATIAELASGDVYPEMLIIGTQPEC